MSAVCSSCGAPIIWARTADGKSVCLDKRKLRVAVFLEDATQVELVTGHESHFATCPDADAHRKSTTSKRAPRSRKRTQHLLTCVGCGARFHRGKPGSRFIGGRDYCSTDCKENHHA